MKNRFDFVRVYEDPSGFKKPYDNIEFVVSNNIIKKLVEIIKLSKKCFLCPSKHQDGRMVICPQDYEQFQEFLAQTKIDKDIGDIKVVYEFKTPLYPNVADKNSRTSYYDDELVIGGYQTLVDCAKELYYDNRQRDEKTENHLKRTFVQQCNKIHKEIVEKYNEKSVEKQ